MQVSDYKPDFTLMYLVFLELDTSIATWILISLVPSIPAKMKILLKLAKKSNKIVIKLSLQCSISHEN